MGVDYAAVWQNIITGADRKSWAVFQNGTAVIFTEPETDVASQATALMKEWGRVHVGSPAGDFTTIKLKDHPGWVVICHHPDILTYVDPSELTDAAADDITIGYYGRTKRDTDARQLKIIHIEDNSFRAPAR